MKFILNKKGLLVPYKESSEDRIARLLGVRSYGWCAEPPRKPKRQEKWRSPLKRTSAKQEDSDREPTINQRLRDGFAMMDEDDPHE